MRGDLYTPVLKEREVNETKSYEIGSLFIIAFFGGIIAVSVLGIRNAKWLYLEKKYIQLLTSISVVLFISKLLLVYAITHQMISMDSSYMNILGRGLGLVCYIFYYALLKRSFKEHLALGGVTEPLIKPGIIWCLISALIEGVILFVVAGI